MIIILYIYIYIKNKKKIIIKIRYFLLMSVYGHGDDGVVSDKCWSDDDLNWRWIVRYGWRS